MSVKSAPMDGGGFDVHRALDFEKRSAGKNGDVEAFIKKVDAVHVAIQAMKDGAIDPADVHVDGVPTIEEDRKMEEEKRRRRADLARREQEACARKKREEHKKWWRGAELLYGDRKRLSASEALRKSRSLVNEDEGSNTTDGFTAAKRTGRPLSQDEKLRLNERYSLEYSRWDTWAPDDPATLSEIAEKEEEEEQKKSKDFEDSNPAFCKQMMDDMKTRSKASDVKAADATAARLKGNRFYRARRWDKALELYVESLRARPYTIKTLANIAQAADATAARLKGNRFYRARRWDKALELYVESLRARPYTIKTLANIAQTLIKLERWVDAVEFCDRALHIDGECVKALSRRASAFVNLAGELAPPEGHASPSAGIPLVPGPSCGDGTIFSVVIDGTRVSNKAGSAELNGHIYESTRPPTPQKRGDWGDDGIEEYMFHDLSGGREGLMALALADLNKAVDVDREGVEDLQRQRQTLTRKIKEELAEARVMGKVQEPAIQVSSEAPAKADGSVTRSVSNVGGTRERDADCGNNAVGEEDDIQAVRRLLEGALGGGGVLRHDRVMTGERSQYTGDGNGMLARFRALLGLMDLLETSSNARVYFRASGGLAYLARVSAARCTAFTERRDDPSSPVETPLVGLNRAHDGAKTVCLGDGGKIDGRQDANEIWLMLRTVAAALEGGERLAQHDVHMSGLLAEPCAQALRIKSDSGAGGDRSIKSFVPEGASVASAAVLVLRRAVDDPDVCMHVAKFAPLLTGLIALINATSTSCDPMDVEASAAILARVLLGRTANAAARTLRQMEEPPTSASAEAGEIRMPMVVGFPGAVHVLARALLAWRKRQGCMQAAPPSVGASLCSALGNLALQGGFRENFAAAFAEDRDGRMTPAAVLVGVAGETQKERSEARVLALSALTNACFRTASTQSATLSAGGLALALAVLSLEGEQRNRHVPPVVAERSALLLARLSAYPPAVEAMGKQLVFERIVKATVRSAALGGSIYAPVDRSEGCIEGAEASKPPPHAGERQYLVQALAVILRSLADATRAGTGRGINVPHFPPSNAHKGNLHEEGATSLITTMAERLGLPNALVCFLPPAREQGAAGVTADSVSWRPVWYAPHEVTANVCGCLLHLLDGKGSERVARQVMNSDGISRLISLFANSGGGGCAEKTTRKNAAICLAKLARDGEIKEAISHLRGMEMLVQAGAGLTT